jgi:hypothetical protein
MIRAGLTAALFLALSRSAMAEAVPARLSSATENPTGEGDVVVPKRQVRIATATRVWYGWQTLATDAIALGPLVLMAAMNGDGAEVFVPLALGTYVLGGPIVHATHGNWGRAGGSLSLRVGAPILCALPVAAIPVPGFALAGLLVGAGLAITLDAAVLARETVVTETAWQPVVLVGKDAAWAGITGRF